MAVNPSTSLGYHVYFICQTDSNAVIEKESLMSANMFTTFVQVSKSNSEHVFHNMPNCCFFQVTLGIQFTYLHFQTKLVR